jgi:hypothetical protein
MIPGAGVAVMALAVAVYGNYAAYVTGWQGLQEADLGGGGDVTGHLYALRTLIFLTIPVAAAGAILALVGSLLPRRQ